MPILEHSYSSKGLKYRFIPAGTATFMLAALIMGIVELKFVQRGHPTSHLYLFALISSLIVIMLRILITKLIGDRKNWRDSVDGVAVAIVLLPWIFASISAIQTILRNPPKVTAIIWILAIPLGWVLAKFK